jgi:DNA polymerase-3 subunit delta'
MKILLIEHIDRATIGSANALLKSLEEPLPHRLIIASTTNKDLLLPTILSRALLIHCDADYIPMSLDEDGKKLFTDMVDALARKDVAVLSK